MPQDVNDNFKVLAALLLDERGWKSTIAERDAIESYRRKTGLLCYVEQTSTLYMLVGGISNSDWKPAFSGGGGQVKSESFTYTSPNNMFVLSSNVTKIIDVIIDHGSNYNSAATVSNGNEVTIATSGILYGGESIRIIYT